VFSSISPLSLLWLGWLVSWLLASGWTAKTVAQQSAVSRIAQSLPIWIGAILLFRSPTGGSTLFRSPPSSGWIAVVLAAVGLGLTWWARINLGRFWSGTVTLKAEHRLVRSGPYSVTRHPIYTGLLVALLATALDHDSLAGLIGFGFILLGLVLKLRQEEQFLEGQFREAYDAYKKEVPALIPGVW
jgi:protein-S-isoprenylcysteine O-methyltransferase Ste14